MKKNFLKGISLLLFLMLCSITQAQEIKGTISDSNGPLPGANVLVKGSTNGTITDFDGNFTLSEVSSNAVLLISYVGYTSKKVNVNGETLLNIILIEDANSLEEVVVVGYGTKKKSLVTGAISSIKSDDIQNSSSTRIEQAIQGKVSGISVLSNSGSPGAGSKIRIRGAGSNGSADPIYIVDGMKTGSIDNLDSGDVESIEILKDAASSAIYGTEGANGVIIIVTKSGRRNQKSKISYNSQFGVQTSRTKMELMNASQYRTYLNEAGVQNIADNSVDTDWLDEVFEDAFVKKHHLSFTGGSEKSSFMLSGSVTDQDGIVGKGLANFKRYTARFNSKHQINDWLEVGNNFSYSNTTRSTISEDDEYRGILNNAILMDPLTPVVYSTVPSNVQDLINDPSKTILTNNNGNVYALPAYATGEIANPVAMLQTFRGDIKTDKILGTFFANFTPFEGFKFTTRFGIDVAYQFNHRWNPTYYVSSERQNSLATVNDDIDKFSSWIWENFATYTNSYQKHNYTVMLGYSAEKYQTPSYQLFSGPLAKEGDNYAYHSYTSDELDKVDGDFFEKRKKSMFGRFSYDYDEKYLLESTLRYDESSAFPSNERGAYFPSVSAGWVISNEDFFADNNTFNYLKIRASWGQNGSDANLAGNGDLQFFEGAGIKIPDGNGGFLSGFQAGNLPNKDLKWERSEQLDLGIDARLLDGKLRLTADYFDKTTKDLIIPGGGVVPLSVGLGFGDVNGGTVSNKGFEFEVGYSNHDNDFTYGINLNMSTLKNEVTKINIPVDITGANVRGFDASQFSEGEPIWYFRGYKTNGIDDATGAPIIVDIDNSGDITPADITNIGSPHPDLLYGGQINLGYKNFDFNLNFQGTYGNEIYMMWNRTDRIYSNKPSFLYENRWTAPGSNASYPKADVTSDELYRSDLMVGNGSYMRIKQIQLGFTLPDNLVQKLKLSKVRMYLSLDDYFTFTKYKGLDPEAGSTRDNSLGIDRGVYPIPGKVLFGLSVNL